MGDKGQSRRADGTIRKEIRVRPGYVPQETVPVYVSPRRRDEHAKNYRYKLINGHYKVVPDDGQFGLWSEG
jgi:hypothetical protein